MATAAVALFIAGAFSAWALTRPEAPPAPTAGDRVQDLELQVVRAYAAAGKAVAEYVPAAPGRIDDLSVSVVPILKGLPGVVKVEVLVTAERPTHRIIHVRDWHYVPKDLYAQELRVIRLAPRSDAEFDSLYRQLLLEAELVQIDQATVLRCLALRHGLRRVFAERLTTQAADDFKEVIAELGKTLARKPELLAQRQDVRAMIVEMERLGAQKTDRYQRAVAADGEISEMLIQLERQFLELGAAPRLLATKEVEEVLPLDDERLLDAAHPIAPDGALSDNVRAAAERETAMVREALKGGPTAVLVLGGAHDLSESVRRLGGGTCEYVRVTTKRYPELGAMAP